MVLLRRLRIENYRSIGAADVRLGPLTFLVGPNGSGKSNCVDTLRFVAEALRVSLDFALRERGSLREVRRRSGGHPRHFALRLDFDLPDGGSGFYAFRVGALPNHGFEVVDERLRLRRAALVGADDHFHVRRGQLVDSSVDVAPAASPDRLFLANVSGWPAFRSAYDFLARMEVYNFNPSKIRELQPPDPGDRLRRDGANAAAVLETLSEAARVRLTDHLGSIVAGLSDPKRKVLGSMETIEFRQTVTGQAKPWRFPAASLSDGTLRAFAVLVALEKAGSGQTPGVIGMEEPEAALHPGAAGVLFRALVDASARAQVVVTSHSPDLLDNPDIGPEAVYAVASVHGDTQVTGLDPASRAVMKERLFTAGELLRQNQLAPDPDEAGRAHQMRLFTDDA